MDLRSCSDDWRGAGLLGTVAPVRGTAALGALWVAVGTLLGLAIPALMTVGIVYLATGLAVAAVLPWVPAPDDRAWRHPLYLGIGTAAFTVTLWALYCATIPGG
jgi:hypothetical protein